MYVLNALDGVLQDMNERVWDNIFFVCVDIFEIIPITDKCFSELYILKYILVLLYDVSIIIGVLSIKYLLVLSKCSVNYVANW